jgi:hypothetical protein
MGEFIEIVQCPNLFLPILYSSMSPSVYQRLKMIIISLCGLSKDAIHLYIGLSCVLATSTLTRRPLRSFAVLIPGLLFSLFMEILDLRDDLNSLGRFRLLASLHDIINTNLMPLVLVLMCRAGWLTVDWGSGERR